MSPFRIGDRVTHHAYPDGGYVVTEVTWQPRKYIATGGYYHVVAQAVEGTGAKCWQLAGPAHSFSPERER
jgi:hypothetical protein